MIGWRKSLEPDVDVDAFIVSLREDQVASDRFKSPGQIAEDHFNRAYAARERDSMPKVPRWDDVQPQPWNTIMTQKPEDAVKEVQRFETPDGELHSTRTAANNHLRSLGMRERLQTFAQSHLLHNMTSDELADVLFVGRIQLLEIYASGEPQPDFGDIKVADHSTSTEYAQLRNLDVMTTMLNACERMVMVGGFTANEPYEKNRKVVETCKAELMRRLDAGPYT